MTKGIVFEHPKECEIKTGLDVFVIDNNGYDLFKGFVLSKNSKTLKILFLDTNFVEDFASTERIILPTRHNEEIYEKQEKNRKAHENTTKKIKTPMKTRKKVKRSQLKFNPYFQPHEHPQSDSSASTPMISEGSEDDIIIYPNHKPQTNQKQTQDGNQNEGIEKDSLKSAQQEVLTEKFAYIESQSEDTSSILPSSSVSSIYQDYQEIQEIHANEGSKITNFNIASYSCDCSTEGQTSTWSIHILFDSK